MIRSRSSLSLKFLYSSLHFTRPLLLWLFMCSESLYYVRPCGVLELHWLIQLCSSQLFLTHYCISPAAYRSLFCSQIWITTIWLIETIELAPNATSLSLPVSPCVLLAQSRLSSGLMYSPTTTQFRLVAKVQYATRHALLIRGYDCEGRQ